MTKFVKAPLPFQGQKRNWLRYVNNLDFSNKVVIDLFGGSGLLSHEIKRNNPSAKVIWNDFDNYQARLEMIEESEELRKNLIKYPKSNQKADLETKTQIIQLIDQHLEKYQRADWITISSWILFSGNYAHDYHDLIKRTFYVRVTRTPLNSINYLQDVERVQCDFRVLLEEYKDHDDVIYICDPPYIMTDQTGYKSKKNKHFKLKDTLQLIEALRFKKALFFSSTKSETDDLLELYFDSDKIERIEYEASTGSNRRYTELLYII
ncbi:DNA adenine methylase [Ignatzschineria rhizosphaerae]|uniref:DNA adenine methylase n=1 Tax=Ignatzschineria rhizosphaerae TaxID=2923279 RepID=A0ABY3X3L2_9GAMM|nr:DNA adenine methylase [Ignatzschineria rhizosphaerae]UNM96047.1 DNA adenine methylase [Ignatzschineria rhizosphaerae]